MKRPCGRVLCSWSRKRFPKRTSFFTDGECALDEAFANGIKPKQTAMEFYRYRAARTAPVPVTDR